MYHQGTFEYMFSLVHSLCPLTYRLNRTKKQSGTSVFSCQAKCAQSETSNEDEKPKKGSKSYAKRVDQEIR